MFGVFLVYLILIFYLYLYYFVWVFFTLQILISHTILYLTFFYLILILSYFSSRICLMLFFILFLPLFKLSLWVVFYLLDFDECLSCPCINGGTCENCFNGFKCHCPSASTGVTCETGQNCCSRHLYFIYLFIHSFICVSFVVFSKVNIKSSLDNFVLFISQRLFEHSCTYCFSRSLFSS